MKNRNPEGVAVAESPTAGSATALEQSQSLFDDIYRKYEIFISKN
jgi:hypothetical protein